MKRFIIILFSIFMSVSLIVGLLLSSITFFVFNTNTYEKEYRKFATADRVGVSEEDLSKVTTVLVDYMKDDRDDLVISVPVDGAEREYFNVKEKAHMVDVKNLCLLAESVRNYALIIFACLVIISFISILASSKIKNTRIKESIKEYAHISSKVYLIISCCFIGMIVIMGIYALCNFGSFWHNFHKLFFSNGLWLLNSRTDLLMRMMTPSMFFADIVFEIILTFVAAFAITILISVFVRKRVRK